MPFNLIKKYPDLLEIAHMTEWQRGVSLRGVFDKDILNNANFQFYGKQIRPIKNDGDDSMDTLFNHLITCDEEIDNKKTGKRVFEVARAIRLHWLRHHIDLANLGAANIDVFSCQERIQGKGSVIRTYIFNEEDRYVIILEPQRSGIDYYLLTAYYIDKDWGLRQIESKRKNRLPEVY